jgi:hypothetical protein
VLGTVKGWRTRRVSFDLVVGDTDDQSIIASSTVCHHESRPARAFHAPTPSVRIARGKNAALLASSSSDAMIYSFWPCGTTFATGGGRLSLAPSPSRRIRLAPFEAPYVNRLRAAARNRDRRRREVGDSPVGSRRRARHCRAGVRPGGGVHALVDTGTDPDLPNAPDLEDPHHAPGDNVPFSSSPVIVYPTYPLICRAGSMPTWLVRATSPNSPGTKRQVGTLHNADSARERRA